MGTTSLQKKPSYQSEEISDWNNLVQQFPEIPKPYDSGDSDPLNAAVSQAENIEIDIEDELDRRVDLRNLPTATIDPDYAHDHDDAVSLLKDGDNYRAWVHIADVGHYVEPGDPIDQASRERGVTFYLGDNTRHMLPDYLAQEICSLKPDTDRLAHTIEMEFDRAANLKDWDIYKSVIKSDAHLTYTHADSIIESSDELTDWYNDSELYNEQAQTFRDLSVALNDLEPLTRDLRDERWDHSLIINPRPSPSSRIIHEMMTAANWAVGQYLREEEGLGIYREEDSPDRGWTNDAVRELSALGFEVPDQVHNPHHTKRVLNDFFEETDFETGSNFDENREKQARKAIITNLPRAKYAASNGKGAINHYGLGLGDYAHFTSPIRRRTDLINHWIISDKLDSTHNLSAEAEHVSAQQKAADESNRLWKGAQG